jgi:hypothetical protein
LITGTTTGAIPVMFAFAIGIIITTISVTRRGK